FYYYAHLDAFAPWLQVGEPVAAGTTLGRVGNTGNARRTPPHLHFGIYRIGLWRTRAVDPVPLLRLPAAAKTREEHETNLAALLTSRPQTVASTTPTTHPSFPKEEGPVAAQARKAVAEPASA